MSVIELLADDLGHLLALDAGLGDVLIQELLASIGVKVEDLSNELLEVQDLDALVAKDLRKRVVLLLSDLEERNVVEEQALQLERRQIQKLLAGPVQADLFELPDFARDMQAFRHCLLPFFSGTAYAIPVQAPCGAPFNSYRYIQISERDTRDAKRTILGSERYISINLPVGCFYLIKRLTCVNIVPGGVHHEG